MEAPEVPLEKTNEHIQEHAEHGGEPWTMGVALSTAILAAIAAIASMLAGQHINEAMISQIRASDQWSYYQAKGIKAGILSAKIDLLQAGGKAASAADTAQAEKYATEQDEVSAEARKLEAESNAHLARHERLAFSVTLFQIAIAVSAIAVLTRRRLFWYVGMLFGAGGIASLVMALVGQAL